MLRGAFEKMVKDQEAMAVTTRFYGPSWVATGAKQTEDLVKEVTNVSEEVKDYLRKHRKKHGLPKS